MKIDETMSQDTAFAPAKQEDTFKFDDAEDTSPDSLTNEETKDTDSASDEDKQTDVSEQRVPYKRFMKVVEERNEVANRIQQLEERLHSFEENQQRSNLEDVEIPSEWEELYGDSEVSKKAWLIQRRREEDLLEQAESRAIDRLQRVQLEEKQALSENEEIIDNNLEELQEKVGRKLTASQEEDILTIVDEFSPVGDDGKYLTLFPFDKAYEIYVMRQNHKGLGTQRARQSVADLTNNTSEGDADSETPFKRGWDNWREAL